MFDRLKNAVLPLIVVYAVSCVSPAVRAADSFTLANQLGTVIASEQFCQLTFKQEAIQAFVEKRVPADDMSFPPTLNLMIQGAEFNMKNMSASARTAHCAQIRRLAVSYGFVEK